MDYSENLRIIEELCEYKDGNTYFMNRARVKGYGVNLSDYNRVTCCAFCYYWQCKKRGIGHNGKWIFKQLAIYIPYKYLCCICSLDSQYHDVLSDNDKERGWGCPNFRTILPSTYDNLPNAAVDITL